MNSKINSFEMIENIKYDYSKQKLVVIYEEYISKLIYNGSFHKHNRFFDLDNDINNIKTEMLLEIFIEALSEDILSSFIELMDEKLKNIFLNVVWNGKYVLDINNDSDIIEKHYHKEELARKYSFFVFKKKHRGYYILSLHLDLIKMIRKYIKIKPKDYNLIEIEGIETKYFDNNEEDFLHNVVSYRDFLENEYIKLSDNKKLLKESKKNIKKFYNIKEYYPELKNLEYLKSESICLLMLLYENEYKKNDFSTNNIKKFVKNFAKGKIPLEFVLYFMNYLKGSQNSINNYKLKAFKNNNDKELYLYNICTPLYEILKNVKEEKFYSVKNILNAYKYREDIKGFLSYKDSYDNYYISEANSERTKIFYYNEYLEYILEPMLKTIIFLLGLMGVFEIYYEKPDDCKKLFLKTEFLSAYSGIKYIKLTQFGEYVFNKREKYNFLNLEKDEKNTDIELSNDNLTVTILGERPIERIFLERVSKKIANNTYKITEETFLKKERDFNILQEKIDNFKSVLNVELPQNWIDFFEDITIKCNSICVENNFVILKLAKHKDLLDIITKDKIIKKLVIKAENYHILVKSKNFETFQEELSKKGFYINRQNFI